MRRKDFTPIYQSQRHCSLNLPKEKVTQTYFEICVLRQMQSNDVAKLKGMCKQCTSAPLLEFYRGEKIQITFVEEVKPMMTLKICDLDSVTEKKKIESAIGKLLDNSGGEMRIRMTTPNCRQQVRKFVTLDADSASSFLRIEKIRISD